uniref:Uncharacterized protein n=1 Tax=Chromera velia CCMP2878 TaxID=1169474 RepID=A0A0G4F9J3_9ALVE|eukprot:Cvel_15906.t1-p1 / transcript=Cvel_15906.t1 / gene=Cvel_15906 / organism=Chromera_velia_CCMP2878 / gene_product=hypothetical protein / transcript_product=hypothetical protein / location=Cvel_scaffold1202:25768-28520(+) / protein_length=529 / sequence_SO=supercontig / SO=protein_coding / is_pseudo=false
MQSLFISIAVSLPLLCGSHESAVARGEKVRMAFVVSHSSEASLLSAFKDSWAKGVLTRGIPLREASSGDKEGGGIEVKGKTAADQGVMWDAEQVVEEGRHTRHRASKRLQVERHFEALKGISEAPRESSAEWFAVFEDQLSPLLIRKDLSEVVASAPADAELIALVPEQLLADNTCGTNEATANPSAPSSSVKFVKFQCCTGMACWKSCPCKGSAGYLLRARRADLLLNSLFPMTNSFDVAFWNSQAHADSVQYVRRGFSLGQGGVYAVSSETPVFAFPPPSAAVASSEGKGAVNNWVKSFSWEGSEERVRLDIEKDRPLLGFWGHVAFFFSIFVLVCVGWQCGIIPIIIACGGIKRCGPGSPFAYWLFGKPKYLKELEEQRERERKRKEEEESETIGASFASSAAGALPCSKSQNGGGGNAVSDSHSLSTLTSRGGAGGGGKSTAAVSLGLSRSTWEEDGGAGEEDQIELMEGGGRGSSREMEMDREYQGISRGGAPLGEEAPLCGGAESPEMRGRGGKKVIRGNGGL